MRSTSGAIPIRLLRRLATLATLALAVSGLACTSTDDVPALPDAAPDATPLDGGPADASPTDGAAADAEAGTEGGTAPDGAVGDAAIQGLSLSAGAAYSRSANYQMAWTFGEGPGNNVASVSSSYRMTLGVVGATQK